MKMFLETKILTWALAAPVQGPCPADEAPLCQLDKDALSSR